MINCKQRLFPYETEGADSQAISMIEAFSYKAYLLTIKKQNKNKQRDGSCAKKPLENSLSEEANFEESCLS